MSIIVCAAFVADGTILMVKRAAHRKWSPRRWDLVGGHVDKGEQVVDALVRECQEEVGLTPLSFSQISTIYENKDVDKQTPFHLFQVTQWSGGEPQLLGDEHSELAWFTLDEMQRLSMAHDGYLKEISALLSNQAN